MWVTKQSMQGAGLAVCLALIVSSCTSGQGSARFDQALDQETETTTSTDSETSVDDGSNGPDVDTAEDGFLEMVEVRNDLEDSRPVDVLEVTSDDSGLVLTFEMGSQQCYGVDASAEEEDGEVVLNVHTGRLPEVPKPCVEGVYPYRVSIPLEDPLDDRAVSQVEPEEPTEEPVDEPAARALTSGKPDIDHLIGLPIEEGVQWAIENELEWQLSSYEGVASEVDGVDENRLSFVAESDKIVRIEWA